MKVRQVRIGEKFVLDDRGGVWEKIEGNMARCFFGPPKVFGTRIEVDGNAFCYVIFDEGPGSGSPKVEIKGSDEAVRVVFYDEDACIPVSEISAMPSKVMSILGVDTILLTPTGGNQVREYHVMEQAYDADKNTLYVGVTANKDDPNIRTLNRDFVRYSVQPSDSMRREKQDPVLEEKVPEEKGPEAVAEAVRPPEGAVA